MQQPLYLAPQLLSSVLHVASSLGSTSVELQPVNDGSTFGLTVYLGCIEPSGEQRVQGTVHLARCARPMDVS